jgi:hypothetical protein
MFSWPAIQTRGTRFRFDSVPEILRRDGTVCYPSQYLGEFWNPCSRSLDPKGYGLSPQKADRPLQSPTPISHPGRR